MQRGVIVHKPVQMIMRGVNVRPLVQALTRQPWLWDEYNARTVIQNGPFEGTHDIWARFASQEFLKSEEDLGKPHDSVWYDAVNSLPQIKDIAHLLMTEVRGERLGGILITKIPPGGMVKPHVDGGWHAEYYDKYAVQLQGNCDQAFCFDNDSLIAIPGDVYWFNNQVNHWVVNNSTEDRITMIVCIRSDRKGA